MNFNISNGSNGAEWITAGDFNGDHNLDLAVTFEGAIGVYLGHGDGTFGAPTFYSSNGFTITATDVDGDGNLDLVLGQNGGGAFLPDPLGVVFTGGLQVLMGNGDGTFIGASAYPIASRFQFVFAIADVNGDGHPDILTPEALLVGDGNGKFTTELGSQFPGLGNVAVTEIRIADLNGDKIPDAVLIAFSSAPFVALGQGGGVFATGSFLSSVPNAIDVNVADVNGDKIPDLLVMTNPSGNGTGIQLQVLLGKGDGTFGAPQQVTLPDGVAKSLGGRVYAADLNNDGKMDLVVVDYGVYDSNGNCVPGGTYILLGAGDGTFGAPATITAVANPFDAAIADLNKDGKLDLVLSNTNYTQNCGTHSFDLAVFLGNGDGTFKAAGVIATTPHLQAASLAAADFNHDGNVDVAMGSSELPLIAFGNGDGTFQKAQALQIPGGEQQIQVADLNGDNLPDIVTLSSGNVITVALNQYAAAPSVSNFSPPLGRPGTSVLITGKSLQEATTVTFGGVKAKRFTVESSTRIRATVPTGAKTGKIGVTTPEGAAMSARTFRVI